MGLESESEEIISTPQHWSLQSAVSRFKHSQCLHPLSHMHDPLDEDEDEKDYVRIQARII